MITKKNLILFYLLSIVFIAVDMWIIILKNNFLFGALPVVLIILYTALFALDKLLLAVVFCTPLSINIFAIPGLALGQINVSASVPAEPVMFGILLMFILFVVIEGVDKSILKHPVSVIITMSLAWILITSVTSTLPIISFKFLVERCWGIAAFYFFGIYLFRNKKNIYSFIWLYVIAFTGVIVYTTIRHAHGHFGEKAAHLAMKPFYNDHTAYGALLAMFLPVLAGLMINRSRGKLARITAFSFFLIFLVALGLSYSRAAWVSVIVALGVLALLMFRIKLKFIFATLCFGVVLFFAFKTQIILKLEKNNKQVSQDISTEIQSISNISSDASNRERLNRWNCAYRMFLDKPYLGFGPGTYSFKYAPYQLAAYKTTISTNLGNGGNAHSEYLGPLAEQGILGFIIVVALAVMVFIMSFRLYYRLKDRELRILVVSIFLGLVTYFIHGMMNNFLDTDKAAVPFWGFIAMLVTIDLQSRKEIESQVV